MSPAAKTTRSIPLSIRPVRTARKCAVFPVQTALPAPAASIRLSRVVLSSFLSFSKNASACVFLCRLRQFDVPEIQSFLEQAKTAAQVRQCTNPAGGAQFIENPRVSFSFSPFQKIVE